MSTINDSATKVKYINISSKSEMKQKQMILIYRIQNTSLNRPAPARAVNLEPGLLTQIDGDSHTGGGSVGRPSSTGGGPEWGPVTRDSEMCGGLAKAPV